MTSYPLKTSPRHRLLVAHYFDNGFNQSEAVRAVYPNVKDPSTVSYKLFNHPRVKAAINQRMAKLEKKHEIDVDWLVAFLVKYIEAPSILAKFVTKTEDGKLDYNFTHATQEELALLAGFSSDGIEAGKTKKFKVDKINPMEAVDRLAKIMGWYVDKKEITGKDGGPVEIENVSDKELARRMLYAIEKASKGNE